MKKSNWLRSLLLVGLISFLAVEFSGCSPAWRKKFIRKKKKAQTAQPILVLVSDEEALFPPRDRYRERFAFWKSWHLQLLEHLGENRKRDVRNLSGAIGDLRSMNSVLTGEPQEKLKEILVELSDLEAKWENHPGGPWRVPSTQRFRLTQLQRIINREYHYSRVKEAVPPGKTEQVSSDALSQENSS